MRPAMRPASAPTLARLHRAVAATATRSVTTRATPPPLTVYYADWARVILPDGHRFPMDKYAETRRTLSEDASLRGKIDLKPSPKATLEEIHKTQSRIRATGVDEHAVERRNQKDWFPDGRTTLRAVAGEHRRDVGVRKRRLKHASRPTESGVSDCGCVRRRERDVPRTND